MRLAALGKNFVSPLLFSPAVAAILGCAAYVVLRSARLAPNHRTPALDAMHYLSTGAASFARGLNDAPKMAALLVAAPDLDPRWGCPAVAAAMALGGLLGADRVAETLGKKVTAMDPGQGFAASLVTAGLVATASSHGLPVSTTHVSVGSLVGVGVATGRARWRKAGEILLAWVGTVPCGAVLAAGAYWAVSRL